MKLFPVGLVVLAQIVGFSRVWDAEGPDFDAAVAPILARRCLGCHGGADPKGKLDLSTRAGTLRGGESGPSVVAGRLVDSPLWERVEAGEMPPKAALPAAELAILRAWIEAGATWRTDPIDGFRVSNDRRAGRDWWSLQPVQRAEAPTAIEPAWGRSPVDRFVAAGLARSELRPAPEATRRSLIRRVCFDLTGLPPTPEEVLAFEGDPDPDAYDHLVDRLLQSPQYGVRWARWWLDLARFGESNGYEYDEFRPDAWRYRDWVVDALNRDVPFDEFARLQIAGDLLHPDDSGSVEATGFLVAGPYDTVGQIQVSRAMRAAVRADEVEDIVGTVSQAFLGLTVHCARCHDHKFDPIRQAEYYRIAASLGGVRAGVRDLAALDSAMVASRQKLDNLNRRLAALEAPVRDRLQHGRGAESIPLGPTPVAAWDFDRGLGDRIGSLPLTLEGGATLTPDGLRVDGQTGFAASPPQPFSLQAKTLEAWVRLDDLSQRGGGVISIQKLDASDQFDAVVFGEQEPGRWLAGSEGFLRTRSLQGPAETEAADRFVHVALTYKPDGAIQAFRNGQPYGEPYQIAGPVLYPAEKARILLGLRHAPATGNRMLKGTIRRARLHNRALEPAEVAASCAAGGEFVTAAQVAQALSPDQKAEHDRLLAEIARVRQACAGQSHRAYAVLPRDPGATRIDLRGNPNQPGEGVTPGGVAAVLGPISDFALPADAPDAVRRVALARWITASDNPLFARVIANRLWQAHFGVGLVATPSDLGFNGGLPTHPELLDWLAREIPARGWSLKAAHRLLVTSSTYRQASRLDRAALNRDSDNRLLWRKAPVRLEAEMVRDAMLQVAGKLDDHLGGPSFLDRALARVPGTPALHYEAVEPSSPGQNRRTLYRAWTRGGRSPLLDAFDCPDPSATTPRRASTTTPLQALAMMNNTLVLHLSIAFADRLAHEAGPDPGAQVDRAFRLAFGRAPDPTERAEAIRVVAQFGAATLARALFNAAEFAYLD